MKKIHRYTVTISGCNAEQAAAVINNRIDHDEDLGFDYDISHEPQSALVDLLQAILDEAPAEWRESSLLIAQASKLLASLNA